MKIYEAVAFTRLKTPCHLTNGIQAVKPLSDKVLRTLTKLADEVQDRNYSYLQAVRSAVASVSLRK